MITLGPDTKQDILVELPMKEIAPLNVSHVGDCGQRQTEGGDAGTPPVTSGEVLPLTHSLMKFNS